MDELESRPGVMPSHYKAAEAILGFCLAGGRIGSEIAIDFDPDTDAFDAPR